MLLGADLCCVLSGTAAKYGSGYKPETENTDRLNGLAAFLEEVFGCWAVP